MARKTLGPWAISLLALVLALSGSAVAAKYIITSTKQIKPSVLKALKGKGGAAGPQGDAGAAGPAGLQGTKGDSGATGAAGPPGTNGKTVLSGTPTPTAGIGVIGDFYIETDVSKIYGPKAASGANGGWGTGTELKGPQGDPWTPDNTLPENATLTGAWTVTLDAGGNSLSAISFEIPLADDLAGSNVHVFGEAGFATSCSGSAAEPDAVSGHLCIYGADPFGAGALAPKKVLKVTEFVDGANKSGALLLFEDAAKAGFPGTGAWAVTG
jgi:hypothetical protein